MKKVLLMLPLTLCCMRSFGQAHPGFGEGVIITKQNDTINCLVELAVIYDDVIAYKKSANEKKLSIQSKDIKSLTTPYKYWENIKLGKNERLMNLLVDGKIKIFSHVTVHPGPSTAVAGGTLTMYKAPTIVYALKNGDNYYKVKRKGYRDFLTTVLSDCKTVVDKINRREYKFDDLEMIVTEYNSCD